jgi:adenine-specific DNA methylase
LTEAPRGPRFIEESFPVKEVGAESAREKNIRHGHISTLHIWWARRPLASSRATVYGALVPTPETPDDVRNTRQFIIDFSKWENSLNPTMIQRARQDILAACGGTPPRVLDPFGGGGAIPLEALRLGCETYSGDLNPVAVLIQKCTLEYPQKFGKPGPVVQEGEMIGSPQKHSVNAENRLLEDVKRWSVHTRHRPPGKESFEKLKDSTELIDVLHRCLLLWEKSRRDEIMQALTESGFGRSEAFFRVAQAVSETLPTESREKKLLDGFLSGRERLQETARRSSRQGELF